MKDLDPIIERIVLVLHHVDHYCVMEANIFHHDINIYNGLKRPLMSWANHVVNILKRCKLVKRDANFKFTVERDSIFHQVFKLSFGSGMEGVEEEKREG